MAEKTTEWQWRLCCRCVAHYRGFREPFRFERPGLLALALSTSGRSKGMLAALGTTRTIGLETVDFTGITGGEMAGHDDFMTRMSAEETPKIHEVHGTLGHIICGFDVTPYPPR